jgi:hypothetical protein
MPRAAPAVAAAVANGAHAELGVPSKNRGSPVKRSWPRCIGPNMRKADDAARRLSLLVASIRLPGWPPFVLLVAVGVTLTQRG